MELNTLAAQAGCKVSGVTMPGRPGARPVKYYFVKSLGGDLLNDGEPMDGHELEEYLKSRIKQYGLEVRTYEQKYCRNS